MSSTGFGIYVHVPHCLQKCHYCDFVTVTVDEPPRSSGDYVKSLLLELHRRSSTVREFAPQSLTSIYFGGGTPSLLPASDILSVLNEIATIGFIKADNCEITIEINPGTINAEKLDLYLAAGVNRFSVGAQTFRDDYLRACGRKHSANDTRETLRLLADRKVNYSFDLLFGLPQQHLADLREDLFEIVEFSPPHVSLYNLTLPKKHFMNAGRADDGEQAEMFDEIEAALKEIGVLRYEISNFAKPGYESRHNMLYWQGASYWGLGLGAHSYFPKAGPFGVRVSNPAWMAKWTEQIAQLFEPGCFWRNFLPTQVENLCLHEALTDFFHTRLRQTKGFLWSDLVAFFAEFSVDTGVARLIEERARRRVQALTEKGLLLTMGGRIRLSPHGYALANAAFLDLTFSADEVIFQ